MSFKEKVENSPFAYLFYAACFGATLASSIYGILLTKFDLVAQDTYTKNTEINKDYVKNKDYDQLKAENVKLQQNQDKINDSADIPLLQPMRQVIIFPHKNDSVDIYGIEICKTIERTGDLEGIRDKVKNMGYSNTELFMGNDKNYRVINYGYACIGTSIKKAIATIKKQKLVSKNISTTVEQIDLTTIAPNGFAMKNNNKLFEMFVPN